MDAPFGVSHHAVDISDKAKCDALFQCQPDVVFHLAAIVSGQAEAEFDTGMRVNLDGTLNVFEAARALGTKPVVVFTSSCAVYGGEIPDEIEDWTTLNPQTSYGAQKAIGELLCTDYSRKGFIDGRAPRLPTITIRPGKPNAAASSFMSSIFREPLQGRDGGLPGRAGLCALVLLAAQGGREPHQVRRDRRPRSSARTVRSRCRAASPPSARWSRRCARWRATSRSSRIRWEPDQKILDIVLGWRPNIKPQKALALGLKADSSFEDNVRYFLEDDIQVPAA